MKMTTARKLTVLAGVVLVVGGLLFHTGTGTLSSFGWRQIAAICPLGIFEVFLADEFAAPTAIIAAVLMVVGIILLGKVFCAWLCPVPPLRDLLSPRKRKTVRLKTEEASAAPEKTHPEADEGLAAPEKVRSTASEVPAAPEKTRPEVTRPEADRAEAAYLEAVPLEISGADRTSGAARTDAVPSEAARLEAVALKADADAHAGIGNLDAGTCSGSSDISARTCKSGGFARACKPSDGGCTSCQQRRRAGFDSRHLILGGTLLTAVVFGFPVFCIVCPIGLSFATLIALWRLVGFSELTLSLLVFPVIVIFELLVLRKWCHRFCPLGALVSLLSIPNRFLRPTVNKDACIRLNGGECTICADVCDELLDPHYAHSLHECTKCGVCKEKCPTGAIRFSLLPQRGAYLEEEHWRDRSVPE
ncbi:MAG: 4Fe-4S binding protein [Coriobacteriales bacterium]|jgi:ferredoxin-type protein NapH|nr:4Fe-4S binding protein [Coriobacteriales bacterium]